VEYDLLDHVPKPPHTEDHRYDPRSVRFAYQVDEAKRRMVLDRTLFGSVRDIFDVPLFSDMGHYVKDGEGMRSLGTIRPKQIQGVLYELSPDDKWKYRLIFVDGEKTVYRLTITDLAWRYFCDRQREEGTHPQAIATHLTSVLRSSQVYLRIGLARGWDKFPNRCYVQITGVYTFPDYLGGRTFADFAPKHDQAQR
jgi:hypothetical protein